MAAPIPATIISGFLGSGKTSMIGHILETASAKNIALIINEFGDLGIDRDILLGCSIEGCKEDDIIELANGCICCTVADDFLPAIQKILARTPAPDHVIIETSGLALPKPLIKAFSWPDIRSRVSVDGVLTLVDAPALLEGQFAHDPAAVQQQRLKDENLEHETPLEELFEDQINAADLIILNKIDMISPNQANDLQHKLKTRLRSGVQIISTSFGKISPTILLGIQAKAEDDLDARISHHDGADDDHDHDDFTSFVLTLPPFNNKEQLLKLLHDTISMHDILRIKGFVAYHDKSMRGILQVAGARINHHFERPWKPNEQRITKLVIIGHHNMDITAITNMLTT